MNNTFPERLKHYRALAGLSQKETAERIYLSQNAYSKYELGRSSPNPETLRQLAKVFGCSAADLIGEEVPAPEPPEEEPVRLTPQERELVEIYRRLDLRKQAELVRLLDELEKT